MVDAGRMAVYILVTVVAGWLVATAISADIRRARLGMRPGVVRVDTTWIDVVERYVNDDID